MSLGPCPDPLCRATGEHQHPFLGEGLYAPPNRTPRPVVAPDDPVTTVKIEHLMSMATIPLKCPKCGACWEGPAFTPLQPGERRRSRVCASCAPAVAEKVTPAAPALAEKVLRAPRRLGARELGERE